MRYSVIYNPIAGRGQSGRVASSVGSMLEARGHDVTLEASERAGHIAELAAASGGDRVLVLGGDGSLREAAAGLLVRDGDLPELGILPFGTGNVVARELGLPLDPLKAAEAMESSASVPFDVGTAVCDDREPEVFLAMLGVGYDAAVAARIGRSRATRFGGALYRRSAAALYGMAGLTELCRWAPPRFSVTVDGGPGIEDGAAMIGGIAAVLSNTETYGKGMAMSPGAAPDDGVLDLNWRTSASPLAGVLALTAAQRRKPGASWVTRRSQGARFVIRALDAARPLTWQLDGDPLGHAVQINVAVQRHALQLIGTLR